MANPNTMFFGQPQPQDVPKVPSPGRAAAVPFGAVVGRNQPHVMLSSGATQLGMAKAMPTAAGRSPLTMTTSPNETPPYK